MIPLLAVIRWRRGDGRRLGLWVPLFLLWLLLLPVAVILLPLVILLLAIAGTNPFRFLGAGWQCLSALRGTCIDFDNRDRALYLFIY